MACRIDRRSFLGQSIAACAGIRSLEEKNLLAAVQDDGKNTRELKKTAEDEPKIPMGQIGDLQISRIIAGGNVISGGEAQSRLALCLDPSGCKGPKFPSGGFSTHASSSIVLRKPPTQGLSRR